MGLIRRMIEIVIGPPIEKLLDMTNVCRCIDCCNADGWQPCENKTDDGERICNWCKGSGPVTYPHCHGIGNAVLKAGWKLDGPVRKQP